MVYTLGNWERFPMPWKECKRMDERLRFIARLLEGERMAPLCREFGISRVTGYRIFNRYKTCGLDTLNDQSRRTYRHAHGLPNTPLSRLTSSGSRTIPPKQPSDRERNNN